MEPFYFFFFLDGWDAWSNEFDALIPDQDHHHHHSYFFWRKRARKTLCSSSSYLIFNSIVFSMLFITLRNLSMLATHVFAFICTNLVPNHNSSNSMFLFLPTYSFFFRFLYLLLDLALSRRRGHECSAGDAWLTLFCFGAGL